MQTCRAPSTHMQNAHTYGYYQLFEKAENVREFVALDKVDDAEVEAFFNTFFSRQPKKLVECTRDQSLALYDESGRIVGLCFVQMRGDPKKCIVTEMESIDPAFAVRILSRVIMQSFSVHGAIELAIAENVNDFDVLDTYGAQDRILTLEQYTFHTRSTLLSYYNEPSLVVAQHQGRPGNQTGVTVSTFFDLYMIGETNVAGEREFYLCKKTNSSEKMARLLLIKNEKRDKEARLNVDTKSFTLLEDCTLAIQFLLMYFFLTVFEMFADDLLRVRIDYMTEEYNSSTLYKYQLLLEEYRLKYHLFNFMRSWAGSFDCFIIPNENEKKIEITSFFHSSKELIKYGFDPYAVELVRRGLKRVQFDAHGFKENKKLKTRGVLHFLLAHAVASSNMRNINLLLQLEDNDGDVYGEYPHFYCTSKEAAQVLSRTFRDERRAYRAYLDRIPMNLNVHMPLLDHLESVSAPARAFSAKKEFLLVSHVDARRYAESLKTRQWQSDLLDMCKALRTNDNTKLQEMFDKPNVFLDSPSLVPTTP